MSSVKLGIALSLHEKTLYISNADRARPVWMAYELRSDGALGPGRVFADATPWLSNGPGLPDGMKVDRDGNLFASGRGGIYAFSPDGALRCRTAGCGFSAAANSPAWHAVASVRASSSWMWPAAPGWIGCGPGRVDFQVF